MAPKCRRWDGQTGNSSGQEAETCLLPRCSSAPGATHGCSAESRTMASRLTWSTPPASTIFLTGFSHQPSRRGSGFGSSIRGLTMRTMAWRPPKGVFSDYFVVCQGGFNGVNCSIFNFRGYLWNSKPLEGNSGHKRSFRSLSDANIAVLFSTCKLQL